MFVDLSPGDFDWSVEPLVEVVEVPREVDEFVSFELVRSLGVRGRPTMASRSFLRAMSFRTSCFPISFLMIMAALKPVIPKRVFRTAAVPVIDGTEMLVSLDVRLFIFLLVNVCLGFKSYGFGRF